MSTVKESKLVMPTARALAIFSIVILCSVFVSAAFNLIDGDRAFYFGILGVVMAVLSGVVSWASSNPKSR